MALMGVAGLQVSGDATTIYRFLIIIRKSLNKLLRILMAQLLKQR